MASNLPQVVFRADGNTRIGLGHIIRCLALAEMLRLQYACHFIIRDSEIATQNQITASGFTFQSIPTSLTLEEEASWLLKQLPAPTIVVLDGYDFNEAYRRQLKRGPHALICLDDMATQHSWCDVIINAAGGISPKVYASEPGAELCLGPAYALLRQPFCEALQHPHQPDTKRIFVNMGGADPNNHTLQLAQQLEKRFPDKELVLVTGAAYPHQQALDEYALHRPNVHSYHNLSAKGMVELLTSCGIFVCPPSGMAYECCAIGGLLLLHPTAENQQSLFHFLIGSHLASPFTNQATLVDDKLPSIAREMQIRQQTIFDGKGAQRYQQVFSALHLTYSLLIRRAAPNDMQLYFKWANDTQVRQHAVNTAPIAWHSHEAWFNRRLLNSNSYLYVLELNHQPVGQVRIEFEQQTGTIDYSVAAEFRGQGLGTAILRRTFAQLRQEKPAPWTLVGQVKVTNPASRRVFERLGFRHQSSVELHATQYDVFVCHVPTDS